jgi:hypothetical protein
LLGRLAARLIEAGDRVVVCYDGRDPRPGSAPETPEQLEAVDLRSFAAPDHRGLVRRALDVGFDRLRHGILATPDYRYHLRSLRRRLDAARAAIRQIGPRLLILGEDGIAGDPHVIKASREREIPVLVCPYGYGSRRDLENALQQKRRAGELILAEGRSGEAVRRRYPHWVMDTPDGPALLLRPDLILAREALGLGLRDPWTVHGGAADRIAVESNAMLRHYRREGLPEAKLSLTGSLYCDVLHQALEADPRHLRAFETASRINPWEVRVLVALPPSFHGERESEFDSFAELCRETLGFLGAQPRSRITVSVHPATLPDDRRAIEGTGVTLSDDYVLNLLPSHDLYVTCFSSTIRWAIACRKPVLNYDMYRFRLPDYSGVEGVHTVDTESEFRRIAQGLIGDPARYETVARAQRAAAEDWGVVDGRSFERLQELVRELAPNHSAVG